MFDEGSFRPSAKLIGDKRYSIICDYLSTPTQAYDETGKKVWEAELDIYGKIRNIVGESSLIPFRYQGQYEDTETGLYYNRFRYYDPQSGVYVSQDPIGLGEGMPNMYVYVSDSILVLDPLGLLTYNTMPGKAGYQKHHIIPQQIKNHDAINKSGMNIHDSSNVKYLPTKEGVDVNSNLAIHKGSHPKYTEAVQADLDSISKKGKKNNWKQAEYKTEVDKVIKKYDGKLSTGKIKCK